MTDLHKIQEAGAYIMVSKEQSISKKMPVFYNPVMKFNRDMSVLLLKAYASISNKKSISIGLPLAGTGVRGIRLLQELPKGLTSSIYMNDSNTNFLSLASQNLELNSIKREPVEYTHFLRGRQKVEIPCSVFQPYNKQVVLSSTDANMFLLCSPGFDYIDIDPFGSPTPFLDAASMRLAREGILAVTATDTSALCGTYKAACRRKYWAEPLYNELMHEIGLRILIRRVQLTGALYEKALTPVFSYSRDHYMRVFFCCKKGKQETDAVLCQHGQFVWQGITAGPLWLGALSEAKVLEKMIEFENSPFLSSILEESRIDTVGYFDIHALCKKHRLQHIPSMEKILCACTKASRTHFSPTGIKAEMGYSDFLKLLQSLA